MKKSALIRKLCLAVGICMLLGALTALLYWQWNVRYSQAQAAHYVQILEEWIPMPQNALLEPRLDNTMATLSIDGVDFVGMIEMPRYHSVLPVCGSWGSAGKYPCRFSGSVKGKNLVIMAHNYTSHFGGVGRLSAGDQVIFTDMDGTVWNYTVVAKDILEPEAVEEMTAGEYDLTLFTCTRGGAHRVTIRCDRV